ncbi:MAG: porin family protein [Gemmatimonadetes bacterium]|nr:porin family protein [Gemmatimonadota bacterium]
MKRLVEAIVTTVTAATLVAAVPVQGQERSGQAPSTRMIRIGFGGGMAVPVGDAGDAFDSGVNGQACLLVSLGVLPPLRFNLGYQKFDLKSQGLISATGTTTIVSGVAGLSIDLFQAGPFRPYVTAGLGAFNVNEDVVDGFVSPDGSTSSVNFGIDGGAGLAIRLGRVEGFVEARVQNVYTESGVVDAESIRSIPVTFGFLF